MICHPLKEEKSIDHMISSVQEGDIDAQNDLLKTYKPFVAKCVSEVCKRYIDPTRDDEFSVGLLGFNEAMLHYSSERGSSFFSFANIVIKRKDRKSTRLNSSHVAISYAVFCLKIKNV